MNLILQPRPKLSLPLTKLEAGLEVLTIPPVLLNFVLVAVFWHDLPNVVPSHFDFAGNANGFSPRWVLWAIALFGLGTYIAMTIVARFPHTFNYIWPISETNAPKQYMLARKFLSILKLEASVLLFFALWNMIQVGISALKLAAVGDLFTLVAMMVITCVAYILSAFLLR